MSHLNPNKPEYSIETIGDKRSVYAGSRVVGEITRNCVCHVIFQPYHFAAKFKIPFGYSYDQLCQCIFAIEKGLLPLLDPRGYFPNPLLFIHEFYFVDGMEKLIESLREQTPHVFADSRRAPQPSPRFSKGGISHGKTFTEDNKFPGHSAFVNNDERILPPSSDHDETKQRHRPLNASEAILGFVDLVFKKNFPFRRYVMAYLAKRFVKFQANNALPSQREGWEKHVK